VWAQECGDDDDGEIYFQRVSDGSISKIVLAGYEENPRIDAGVIVFAHSSLDGTSQDVMIYTIATNTLLKVTNTPTIPKLRPDVSVLNGGNIRVAWVNAPTFQQTSVQGVTFTPTGGPVQNMSNFAGFRGPFKLPPALNSKNGGATIPVQFSLGGDRGLNIFAAGSPSSVAVNCKSQVEVAGTSEPAVGPSDKPLKYDPSTGTYTYQWRTSPNWAGTCRKFILQFADGGSAFLIFQFG